MERFVSVRFLSRGKGENKEEMNVKFYVGLDIFKGWGNYFGCLLLL